LIILIEYPVDTSENKAKHNPFGQE